MVFNEQRTHSSLILSPTVACPELVEWVPITAYTNISKMKWYCQEQAKDFLKFFWIELKAP
jgi:hypothetical protein